MCLAQKLDTLVLRVQELNFQHTKAFDAQDVLRQRGFHLQLKLCEVCHCHACYSPICRIQNAVLKQQLPDVAQQINRYSMRELWRSSIADLQMFVSILQL